MRTLRVVAAGSAYDIEAIPREARGRYLEKGLVVIHDQAAQSHGAQDGTRIWAAHYS